MDQRETNQILSDVLDVLVTRERMIDVESSNQLYNNNNLFRQIEDELFRMNPADGQHAFEIVYRLIVAFIDQKRREQNVGRGERGRYSYGGGYVPDGARDTFGMTPSNTRVNSFAKDNYSTGQRVNLSASEMFENMNIAKSAESVGIVGNQSTTVQADNPAVVDSDYEGSGGVLRSLNVAPEMTYKPKEIDKKLYNISTSCGQCGCGDDVKEKVTSPVLDYHAIAEIIDDKAHPVDVFHVINHVPEFDIMSGIKSIASHNSRFFNGRHIIIAEMIIYNLIPRNCGATTLTSLDINRRLVGEDNHVITIPGQVTEYIKDILGGVSGMSPFKDNLKDNVNAELKRWCREVDCDDWLEIDHLLDLGDIMEKSKKGQHPSPAVTHREFPRVAVNCLKRSLESMVTNLTNNGVVDMGDALFDIMHHPDFIIRKQGITERDRDLSSPAKLDIITKLFTVFPQRKRVCYANFIPEGLEDDLRYDYILMDKEYNPIDLAMTGRNLWGNSVDFICEDDNKMVQYRNGANYAGTKIIFKDDVLNNHRY